MDPRDWISRFARELGVEPPTSQEFDALLELAGLAAHSSQRVAAPVACWVTARAGLTPQEGLAAARTVTAGGTARS